MAASARLEDRVRKDFGARADEALGRLATLSPPLAEKQSRERLEAAVVLLAGGDPMKLARAAADAERDWRDVVVWSGLGNGDWAARVDEELGAEAP